MKSYELFVLMPTELGLEIIQDLHSLDKQVYRAVLESVAQTRKVRPVFLERQPRTQRHATILSTLGRPPSEPVAENVLRTWLLKKQTGLLTDFLDALKIKHENGVVENLPETVDDTALEAAITQLLGKHRPNVVALYLTAFNDMNETRWDNLARMLDTDPRLQFTSSD